MINQLSKKLLINLKINHFLQLQSQPSYQIMSHYLGVFHQHVLPWDSYILQFQEAVVNFIKAKLGTDVSNHNT